MRAKILIGLTALFLTACGQSVENNSPPRNQTVALVVNQTVKPPTNQAVVVNQTSGNQAATIPTNSTAADKSKIKTFDGKGTVTKINLELGSVALDHEEIKGLMPAMEGMEFYVNDKKLLNGLKVGDKVDFVLEDNAGAEQIVGIKKTN